MYGEGEDWDYPFRSSQGPKRDVVSLRVADLMGSSLVSRPHRKRDPLVIDGAVVKETLRDRLNRESRELEEAIVLLAGQLTKRTQQLEHLNRFPDEDPFQDGDIIQFEKSFPNSPDTYYSYAGRRVHGRWFLTGSRAPQDVTWDDLVSWMGLGVNTIFKMPTTAKGRRVKVVG